MSSMSGNSLESQADRELVARFLERVAGRAGTWIEANVGGVTANDVSRWRRGTWKSLSEPKRAAVQRFVGKKRPNREAEATAAGEIESEDEATGRAILGNPEFIRRLLGKFERKDVRSRLAVVNHYAEEYVGHGQTVPQWLEEIRQQILADAAGASEG